MPEYFLQAVSIGVLDGDCLQMLHYPRKSKDVCETGHVTVVLRHKLAWRVPI